MVSYSGIKVKKGVIMGQLIYVVLVVFMVLMIFKNIKLIKRSKHTKKYIECTNAIFEDADYTNEKINSFIEEEDDSEFKMKGRIIKVYAELKTNIDPWSTLSFLDLHDLIYTKNSLDVAKMEMNSDSFYWMIMNNILAHIKNKEEVVTKLNEVMTQYHDLINNDLVIELYDQVEKALSGDEEGTKFLKALLNGEYSGYRYDKRMIGMYKNVALAIIAYLGEEISLEDKSELTAFAEYKAGKLLLANLGILEEYLGKEYNFDEEKDSEEAIETEENGDK